MTQNTRGGHLVIARHPPPPQARNLGGAGVVATLELELGVPVHALQRCLRDPVLGPRSVVGGGTNCKTRQMGPIDCDD